MPAEIAYIYAMGTSDGPTKIGYSLSPKRRLKDIQRIAGKDIVVTGTWPVGARIALNAERYVHWQLRERHIRGEWFNASRAEIIAAVEAAISRTGEFDPNAVIPSIDPGDRLPEHPEQILTRFPKGTKDSIDAVLEAKEKRADLIREAVGKEIRRRERLANSGKTPKDSAKPTG
jgi:hypothetical protein